MIMACSAARTTVVHATHLTDTDIKIPGRYTDGSLLLSDD